MFIYVFFLKVAEVLGAVAGANSLLNVWMPNFIFGSLRHIISISMQESKLKELPIITSNCFYLGIYSHFREI